jgi:hypothetical protein
LLNQSEIRQYFKITKAFQTDGNVYLAATDPANSQYLPEDIEAWLDVYAYGTYVKSIALDTVMILQKDSGDFYFPSQLIYATPINTILNENEEYRLKIKIKSSGNLLESTALLVKDFSIVKPIANVKYVDFSSNYPSTVQWKSAVNGLLYEFGIRFFYTDVPASGSSVSRFFDWKFPQQRSENTDGGDKMEFQFTGKSFYDQCLAHITPPANGMIRYADSLHYIFYVADEEFTIYLDINAPSNSIVQERPSYTNIANGLGVFASRYRKIKTFNGLTQASLDTLINSSRTSHLGFHYRP